MSKGLALTQDLEVQLLLAYVAGLHDIEAVAVTPGWHVAGAFYMSGTENVRLEIIGNVSDPSLVLRCKIYRVRDAEGNEVGEDVSGSYVQLSSTVTKRALSGVFELAGGYLYEIQMEVTGGVSTDLFGNLTFATVTN
jgi:hypothetical protein